MLVSDNPCKLGGTQVPEEVSKALETLGIKVRNAVEDGWKHIVLEVPTGWYVDDCTDGPIVIYDNKNRYRATIIGSLKEIITWFRPDASHRVLNDELWETIPEVSHYSYVVVYEGPRVHTGKNTDVKADEKAMQLATQWLDEHYPDWRNPAAYWD